MVDNWLLQVSALSASKGVFLLYTDPGAGSLLWQLLLASFIGGAFYIRLVTRKVRERVTGLKKTESSEFVETANSQQSK